MSMKASDLSDTQRKAILNHIRTQVGDTQYSQLRDSLGDDGLIDAILLQASKSDVQTAQPKSGIQWVFYLAILLASAVAIYFPDGSVIGRAGEIFETVFNTVLVCGGVLFVLALIISLFGTNAGFDFGDVYWIALIVAAIIAGLGGIILNISKHGLVILAVAVVSFVYCYLVGIILGVPTRRYLENSSSGIGKVLVSILGVGSIGALLYGGWRLLSSVF